MIQKSINLKEIWKEEVPCVICGEYHQQLVSHLRHKHKMTTKQYREEYPGFPIQCGNIAKLSKGTNNPNYKHGNKVKEELIGIENQDYVICQECGKKVRMLTTSGHLALHKLTRKQYIEKYPGTLLTCEDFKDNTCSVANLPYEERRRRSVKALEGREFGHNTFTVPHRLISEMLNQMDISHSNEQVILNTNIDIVIDDRHFIEIQGDYWHCNPLKYCKSKDHNQSRKVRLDIVKANIFKENGFNILYLWEGDILKRPEVCKQLIIKYLNNDLCDFHSFNYDLINDVISKTLDIDFAY